MTQFDMNVESRKILLVDFELNCNIGAHSFEQDAPQRVIVNIELTLRPDISPSNDALASVVDYDYLRFEISKLIQDRHFALQETLCEEIARICLFPDGVVAARIRTGKPDVYGDCATVNYEMTVSKA